MTTVNKYYSFLQEQMNGTNIVDFDTHVIKIALMKSTYIPLVANQRDFYQLSNEVVGSSYTTGGIELTTKVLGISQTGVVIFSANNVNWPSDINGFTDARYAVIYRDDTSGQSPVGKLILYIDFEANKTNVGGDFSIIWDSNGIINWY